MTVITQKFDWDADTAIRHRRAVQSLVEHEGWEAFMAAVEQRKLNLIQQLTSQTPSDKGADYERVIGEIRGLDSLQGILEGVERFGRDAERELRQLMEGTD